MGREATRAIINCDFNIKIFANDSI
jgi:hypothetical protein